MKPGSLPDGSRGPARTSRAFPWARAVAVWLLLMLAETAHGIVRGALLAPVLGDFRARQVSVLTGSMLILFITWQTTAWLRLAGPRQALLAGGLWAMLTIGFEAGLGRLVLGYDWAGIAADFDLTRGGLLPLGLMFMAVAPWLVGEHRRRRVAAAGGKAIK